MNGGCRRLLKTAVPTLHLNLDKMNDSADNDDDAIDLPMDTESLSEHLIDGIEDSIGDGVVGIQEISSFDPLDIKFDSVGAVTKSTQRRDICECTDAKGNDRESSWMLLLLIPVRLKEVSIQKAKHSEATQLKPNKYSYLNEIHTKHKLKSQQADCLDMPEEVYLIEEKGKPKTHRRTYVDQNQIEML